MRVELVSCSCADNVREFDAHTFAHALPFRPSSSAPPTVGGPLSDGGDTNSRDLGPGRSPEGLGAPRLW